MNRNKEEQIAHDHLVGGISFRNLAVKYGISCTSIYRTVEKYKLTNQEDGDQQELPDDVSLLKALLRKERLKNELLNNIIDIADQELGTNIRKKSGTRRSE